MTKKKAARPKAKRSPPRTEKERNLKLAADLAAEAASNFAAELEMSIDEPGDGINRWRNLLAIGKPKKEDPYRTVAQMSPAEQIERLAVQRNTLWQMVEEIVLWLPEDQAEMLHEHVDEVVSNPYAIEGFNPQTQEALDDKPSEAAAPYLAAAARTGGWR